MIFCKIFRKTDFSKEEQTFYLRKIRTCINMDIGEAEYKVQGLLQALLKIVPYREPVSEPYERPPLYFQLNGPNFDINYEARKFSNKSSEGPGEEIKGSN